MQSLTKAEKQILMNIALLDVRSVAATEAARGAAGDEYFGMFKADWARAMPGLLDKGLLPPP